MNDEVAAVTAALEYALTVAIEQDSPAFVSIKTDEYRVGETQFDNESTPLCRVYPDNTIQWEH